MTKIRQPEAGFTLVEMLVALTIFAILASAGVAILRSSVDTQSAVDTHLGKIRDLGRLDALLTSDLGQAVNRPTRGPSGERPALVGEAQRMQLVRTGWANYDGSARSDLQRVEWRLDQGKLTRVGFDRLDGADEASAAATIARDVASAAFRYRNAAGEWSGAFVSTEQEPLPAAVEATVTPSGKQPVVIVVALPKPAVPPPPAEQAT